MSNWLTSFEDSISNKLSITEFIPREKILKIENQLNHEITNIRNIDTMLFGWKFSNINLESLVAVFFIIKFFIYGEIQKKMINDNKISDSTGWKKGIDMTNKMNITKKPFLFFESSNEHIFINKYNPRGNKKVKKLGENIPWTEKIVKIVNEINP